MPDKARAILDQLSAQFAAFQGKKIQVDLQVNTAGLDAILSSISNRRVSIPVDVGAKARLKDWAAAEPIIPRLDHRNCTVPSRVAAWCLDGALPASQGGRGYSGWCPAW
jgi:hypothetical protein